MVSVDIIREVDLDTWHPAPLQQGLEPVLEGGNVLYFPKLAFRFSDREQRFLSRQWADEKAKNISYRGEAAPIQGALGTPAEQAEIKAVLARYAASAESLVKALFPHYATKLRKGFASYRTAQVEGRKSSWRKDDTRLHVDAFPSNPTAGRRLLRVFANVNPVGVPRVWRVGEPFADHARRFMAGAPAPLPGSAWLLNALHITKSLRTPYDHYMNQLHDRGKADLRYQAESPQATFGFPAGTVWIVYSDQVLHAVMSGQYMMEQTFYLEPDDLHDPATAPLRVLEAIAGRALV